MPTLHRVTSGVHMKSMKRSVKSPQVEMRELALDIIVTAGVPAVAGFDAKQIKQIIDVGVGIYTIIFLRPFNVSNTNLPKAIVTPLEADAAAHMSASAYDRVTITVQDLAGVAADRSVSLIVKGCDHRFNY